MPQNSHPATSVVCQLKTEMRFKRCTCVTLDLWETLLVDEPEKDFLRREMRCEGLRQALSRFSAELSMMDLLKGYDESIGFLQESWRRNQDVPTVEQIRYIVNAASKGTVNMPESKRAVEELQEAYTTPVLAIPPVLNSDAFFTLESMRNRAYKLGLISNTGRTHGRVLRKLLDKFGILDHFDATIFSDEVGWLKPDRRIFMAAADELKVEPTDVVHIGDDPERDVWGAKQAGMRAILFDHEVPKGFKEQPGSLFALGRATRSVPDSEIKPDGRISSLREALKTIDSFGSV